MADNKLQVDPDRLRMIAVAHANTADACVSAKTTHPQTVAAAESLGILFARTTRAAIHLVNARAEALTGIETSHRATQHGLLTSAARFETTEDQNRAALILDPPTPGTPTPTSTPTQPPDPPPTFAPGEFGKLNS
jgi:Excreted virulence factor EspC, type VII ESX diderm